MRIAIAHHKTSLLVVEVSCTVISNYNAQYGSILSISDNNNITLVFLKCAHPLLNVDHQVI